MPNPHNPSFGGNIPFSKTPFPGLPKARAGTPAVIIQHPAIPQAAHLLKERVNSVIHGMGVLFGIIAVPILTTLAVRSNDPGIIAGASLYGLSFLAVFTFSTCYHGFQQPRAKKLLELLDHISIYFLIAGTYTPLVLSYFNNSTGRLILVILWTAAMAGSLLKIFFGCRFNLLSTIIYVLMGCILVWTGGDFFAAMPQQVIKLIISGGVLYSIGVVFYLWEKLPWNHATWHLFVLAAAICHYAAILTAVSH